ILAQSVLPQSTRYLPKAAYGAQNVSIGVMIVFSPLLYGLRTVEYPHNRTGVREAQYQGFVWCFLLASALRLWAVLGERLTVALVLGEIEAGGALPSAAFALLVLLVLAAIGLLSGYSWRGIYWIVTYQSRVDRREPFGLESAHAETNARMRR